MRLTRFPLPLLALLTAASPPQRGLTLSVPSQPDLPVPYSTPAPVAPPTSPFTPAPLPNRDIDGPAGPRAASGTSVGPSLFTRSDTYRGEGFNPGSTAQSDQEKRAKPAAGFSLRMPITPN